MTIADMLCETCKTLLGKKIHSMKAKRNIYLPVVKVIDGIFFNLSDVFTKKCLSNLFQIDLFLYYFNQYWHGISL